MKHSTAERAPHRKLGLSRDAWTISFQSQVGREEWLRPYTDETLIRFANDGRRRVTVMCPGFAADCLVTLEEIALRNRAAFLAHGGERYDYIPALNAHPAHAELLARLIDRHAAGWLPSLDDVSAGSSIPPRREAAR